MHPIFVSAGCISQRAISYQLLSITLINHAFVASTSNHSSPMMSVHVWGISGNTGGAQNPQVGIHITMVRTLLKNTSISTTRAPTPA